MKFFICALVVLVAATLAYAGLAEDVKKPTSECMTEHGLTEADLKGKIPYQDQKIKCFLACIMKKMGMMEDGKFVIEKALEVVSKDKPLDDATQQQSIECMNKANEQTDECEAAGALYKCQEDAGVIKQPASN